MLFAQIGRRLVVPRPGSATGFASVRASGAGRRALRLSAGDAPDQSNHKPDRAAVAQQHIGYVAESNSVVRSASAFATLLRVRFERRYPHSCLETIPITAFSFGRSSTHYTIITPE